MNKETQGKIMVRGNEEMSVERTRDWLADHEYFLSFTLPSASPEHGAHLGMLEMTSAILDKDENIGAFVESDNGNDIDDLKTLWLTGGLDGEEHSREREKLATAYSNFMEKSEGEVVEGRYTDYHSAKELEKASL